MSTNIDHMHINRTKYIQYHQTHAMYVLSKYTMDFLQDIIEIIPRPQGHVQYVDLLGIQPLDNVPTKSRRETGA